MKEKRKIILISDYGRSGQGWLSYMLCYILNAIYIEPYALLGGGLYTKSEYILNLTSGNLPGRKESKYSMVVKTHNYPSREFNLTDKVIFLMRDPRDVTVSAYFMNLYCRKIGIRMSWKRKIYEFLFNNKFKNLLITCNRWIKYYDGWKHINSYKVKYEDLLLDTEKILRDILFYLEVVTDENLIREAIERFSFKVITGRDRGQEDLTGYIQKTGD